MATPPGMRCATFSLENGDKVLVYSDPSRIFLQLRHSTPTGPTEQDILPPSFKVAVSLNEGTALALASELVSIVATRLKAPLARQDEESE
jgi:hypothetical protein